MNVTLELLAILWLLGAGLLVLVVVVSWFRIGRLRDTLDEIRKLLIEAQGVNLLHEVKQLRVDVEGQMKDFARRLEPLEQERVAARAEFIDTNRRVLAAMDALRLEWQQQRESTVTAVAAEARALFAADVRHLVRDEFYKVREKAGGDPKEPKG
jgi:hypothetical protein